MAVAFIDILREHELFLHDFLFFSNGLVAVLEPGNTWGGVPTNSAIEMILCKFLQKNYLIHLQAFHLDDSQVFFRIASKILKKLVYPRPPLTSSSSLGTLPSIDNKWFLRARTMIFMKHRNREQGFSKRETPIENTQNEPIHWVTTNVSSFTNLMGYSSEFAKNLH